MPDQLTKWFTSSLAGQIPGGFASRGEFQRIPKMIGGYLFVGILPERMADGVFQRLRKRRDARLDSFLEQDPIVERMKALLDGYCSDLEIRAHAERYYERRMEDTWGRWQASHKPDWPVRTELKGLDHVSSALQRGGGVVFWGMSFCGTLFPKIALSRAEVALTQLSSADHGTDYPLTLLGKLVVGPLHCLPEARYLCKRIRIPANGDNSYLHQIGQVLQNNGCVWISGENVRAKKTISAEVLGRPGHFPVGAPMIALRHHATLLPVHTQRLGPFHYRVTVEPPIQVKRGTRSKEVIDQAVQDYAHRLATQILKNPGDWDWSYDWAKKLLTNR